MLNRPEKKVFLYLYDTYLICIEIYASIILFTYLMVYIKDKVLADNVNINCKNKELI